MAESNTGRRGPRPVPPPRNRRNTGFDHSPDSHIYEEVNTFQSISASNTDHSSKDCHPPQTHSSSTFQSDQSSQSEYSTVSEGGENLYSEYESFGNNEGAKEGQGENKEYVYILMNQPRRDERNSKYFSYDYPRPNSSEIMKKIERFKSRTKEFINAFESTHDEIRTDEETFIIVHLLKKSDSNTPILDGNLEKLAMLACCSSPHVVKRALDSILNEVFLSISDTARIRCRNILKAEEILRASFLKSMKVDHFKAKSHRMTTYAWLITLVLLKCNKDECIEIQPKIKEFDKTLDALQSDREHSGRNTFRYGVYLARECIKRISQLSEKRDSRESLHRIMKKCENMLNSKLEKDEVMKLGKALSDGGSRLDLHVCLVFLQDLPKFYRFQDNRKPIILIQMLIADFRERCDSKKVKSLLKISNYEWQFEMLVYRLMLRLIRTSKNNAIIEQVLTGEQGCGGVIKSWIENKSKTNKNQLYLMHLEKLCQRAVFVATPNSFKQFITDNCKGDEKQFIENLSILQLSATYRDQVLEILPESRVSIGQQLVSTYDALMNGKKCLLKLHQHPKEEVLETEALKNVPLRDEIEILKVLNAAAEPCPNVVRLLGSSIKPPLHMIIERTPKGNLLTYLQGLSKPPEAKVLLQIALDICNAMIYLGGLNIIHRDLCAKNCFVFMHEGNLLTKLGDFYLAILSYSSLRSPTGVERKRNSVNSSRNEYSPNQFAARWMAVEAIQFGEFSTASDVWSYGMLLSEIFTFGCKPYVNMPSGRSLDSDQEVREFVLKGDRLELHPKIPESIQVLIQLTMVDADHRPTFLVLKENLQEKVFPDETYADPAHFGISHGSLSGSDTPINSRTGCNANGCTGECLNASDIAAPLNVDDSTGHFIKEFIPASSSDILKLSELQFPSLAVITERIVHDEKLELITEVGDMGSLEEFINSFGCPTEDAMKYLSQIGEAVSFLHNRRFIHRNLRAASVFIYSNGNAKLACFARVRKLKPNPDDVFSTMPIKLPMSDDSLRWSSPEVITDGMYSKASDMWAFGVLIWEIFTLIDKDLDESDEEISHLPYHHLTSKDQICPYLKKGKRLGQPKNCPNWLYEMMLDCWEYNAEDRLRCQDIVQPIKEQTTKNEDEHE